MPYVQQRRGTASALASANEIPLAGQLVVETDTGKIKVGDGTTVYSGLEYVTDPSNIADGAIATNHLADSSVTVAKVADNVISETKIQNLAVTTSKIAADAVTAAKIATDAVTSAKIIDNAVTEAKVANDAISTDKIVAASITSVKLASGSVAGTNIQGSAVSETKIATDAVTTDKIKADAVTESEILASAVTEAKIDTGAVSINKIATEAVTEAKIATGAVSTNKIAAGAVGNGELANNAVTETKIADDAVTFAKMQDINANRLLGSVSAGQILEISCKPVGRDLLDSANEADARLAIGAQVAGTYATLVSGTVPASQLPGYVDDVEEYNNLASFPSTGEAGKLYVDKATNKAHRWTGSTYVAIEASPGTTDVVTEGSNNLYYTDARADARVLNNIKDEDDFASNSATHSPSQQATKAYIVSLTGANTTNISANASAVAAKMPLAGGTFTGDVTIGQSSTGGAIDIILPRQSNTTKHQIRFLHNNTDGFSLPANELDFIRLYTDSTSHAGMGISSGHMNIGTKGNISLDIYAGGSVRTEYDKAGVVTHLTNHNFGTNVNVGGRLEVPRADSPGTPKIVSEYNGSVDTDTGIYFPAGDNVAISCGGDRKIDITKNQITLDRKNGYPTIKSSPTGVDGAAAGWMIIDSNGSDPVSLNHFSNNDIWLNYNNDGNAGGTLIGPTSSSSSAGTHKLKVFGTAQVTGDFFAGIANGGGLYHSVARAGYNGTQGVTNCAYAITGDGNTGLFFPNQFNSSAAAGTTGDEVALATAGVRRLHIDKEGQTALNADPHESFRFYVINNATDHVASGTTSGTTQNGVFSGTHTITDTAIHNTIGVNASSVRTVTTDNIHSASYNRAGHFAASTRTQTGVTVGPTIGVYAVANHFNSDAGNGGSLVGVQGLCYESSPSATASTAYGLFGRCSVIKPSDNSNTTSSITSAHALYGDITRSTGTITNGYGLYLGDIDATNKYGVYQLDTEATNVFQGRVQFASSSGSAGSYLPGISFIGDGNTGIGRTVADVVDVVCGGNIVSNFSAKGLHVPQGSQAEPSISQMGNTDTGISFGATTANQINLNVNGAAKVSINPTASYFTGLVQFNGSFTDGTTTKTAAQLMAKIAEATPSHSYASTLLFG